MGLFLEQFHCLCYLASFYRDLASDRRPIQPARRSNQGNADRGHHNELPTKADYGLLIRSQPFFKYRETKEHLMIVVPPGCMLFEQFTDSLRAKKLIDPRPIIEQRIRHPAVDGSPEPIIHYVTRKTSFWPFHDRFG